MANRQTALEGKQDSAQSMLNGRDHLLTRTGHAVRQWGEHFEEPFEPIKHMILAQGKVRRLGGRLLHITGKGHLGSQKIPQWQGTRSG